MLESTLSKDLQISKILNDEKLLTGNFVSEVSPITLICDASLIDTTERSKW